MHNSRKKERKVRKIFTLEGQNKLKGIYGRSEITQDAQFKREREKYRKHLLSNLKK